MLKIGFSRKYFTLWDVTESVQYAANGQTSRIVVHNVYIRNLAMDQERAFEKAKSFGVKQLVVDNSLFGKSGSFDTVSYPKDEYQSWEFSFGKYRGEDIRQSNDVGYLTWLYKEIKDHSIHRDRLPIVVARVVELDNSYVVYNDELMTVEQMEKEKETETMLQAINDNGYIDCFIERNPDGDGELWVDGVWVTFPRVKSQWYNGYTYYLPVIDGKAVRVKNKHWRLFVEKDSSCPNSRYYFKVVGMEKA